MQLPMFTQTATRDRGAGVSRKVAYDITHLYSRNAELILGLRPANEIRRYFVTMSHIGWTQA